MTYQRDERLEKVEQITINWETFKKALKRNYLNNNYHDRIFVLRLYPPFESEMEAEYYESMQGQHYDDNWNETPYHIKPEIILLEGTDGRTRPFNWIQWPTKATVKDNLTENEIEEIGGIEEALKESREIYWDEMKSFLPDTFDISVSAGIPIGYEVDINWVGVDD